MKNFTLLTLLLAIVGASSAQTPIGKMVVGIEAGFDVQQFSQDLTPRVLPAIQVEYPVGKFSFGFGLGKKLFRDYSFAYATGQTEAVLVGERMQTFYLYEKRQFDLGYWYVPLKADLRFRCNCMYVHAGVNFEFLDDSRPERLIAGQYRSDEPLDNELSRERIIRKNTRSYELGFGFKLHANDYVRLVARPTYVLSENPELDAPNPLISTLRMTFGLQYAFFHY